jgi:D-3-phosphoglycerate dehydrogenase
MSAAARPFRVALSGDFRKADGTPTFPSFDLAPLLSDPAVAVTWVDPVDGEIRAADVADCDALILLVPRFSPAGLPDGAPLRLVARFGVGYDSVDVAACTAAGIGVSITPDGVRRPVAVAVITFVLALSQRLIAKDRLTRRGPAGWAERGSYMGTGLVGRTLGQLGLGNIGVEVMRLAAPFGLRLIAHDPYCNPGLAASLGVELVSSDELFRRSDFLSVSIPLSAETRHYVGAGRLALMQPTAFLINTARGGVVDQKALAAALREGRLAGAAIDVFEEEPCPADDPLLALDNVIATPHAICWTDECFAGIGAADVAAVRAVMRGEEPRVLVDRRVVDDPRWTAALAFYRSRFA